MNNKNKTDLISRIPSKVWLLLSLLVAIAVWSLLSMGEKTGRAFPPLLEVFGSYTRWLLTVASSGATLSAP